jgi:hypothetical protein
MSLTVRDLQGDELVASDGSIGSVDDVYFDDERWVVRYFVVDTGAWLPGRQVLISPASMEPRPGALRARLSRDEVKRAPGVEIDEPVSRRYEKAHAAYFGYPYYWNGPLLWGAAGVPLAPVPATGAQPLITARQAGAEGVVEEAAEAGDAHLRSAREVIGYAIEARDGAIGEVQDFVVDERDWAIRDVVVDTRTWWPGGHVRVHPAYVERIEWGEKKMVLRLTLDEVRNAGAQTPRR